MSSSSKSTPNDDLKTVSFYLKEVMKLVKTIAPNITKKQNEELESLEKLVIAANINSFRPIQDKYKTEIEKEKQKGMKMENALKMMKEQMKGYNDYYEGLHENYDKLKKEHEQLKIDHAQLLAKHRDSNEDSVSLMLDELEKDDMSAESSEIVFNSDNPHPVSYFLDLQKKLFSDVAGSDNEKSKDILERLTKSIIEANKHTDMKFQVTKECEIRNTEKMMNEFEKKKASFVDILNRTTKQKHDTSNNEVPSIEEFKEKRDKIKAISNEIHEIREKMAILENELSSLMSEGDKNLDLINAKHQQEMSDIQSEINDYKIKLGYI